jgi:hypothetical protein
MGAAGAASRGGPQRRGSRCAVVRVDVGTAELAGGGRRRCARVVEERHGESERSGMARRRRGARRGWARRGEASATTSGKGTGRAIWRKTANCRSGR